MRKVKYYKCPECQKKFSTLGGWSGHINLMHPNIRPEGYTDARFFYYTLTGKTEGKCIECKSPTDWNEATGKYNRFCNNPACKKAYVKMAKSRMVNKYGREYLLNDPEMQKKMLAAKKISGYYSFSNGSGKVGYVGTYEKDFLQMMDKFMGYSASDIMGPSPHTYYYEYKGAKHFYIPDFYIPNLNLEIEIKTQDNKHPKIQAVDKVKEKLKDEVMTNNPKVNYLKINDKDYTVFFDYLLSLKESIDETTLDKSGKNIAEINQALESAMDYIDDEAEEGFEYDSHLCALQEGTFIETYEHDTINHEYIYFIFYTSISGTRETGFVTGSDKFANVAVGRLNLDPIPNPGVGSFGRVNSLYVLTPEFDGEFFARTLGLYVKETDPSLELSDMRDPLDFENEYMLFAIASDVMYSRVEAVLSNHVKSGEPLLYDWDKIGEDWINHQNKYHYFCYSILNTCDAEFSKTYNENSLSPNYNAEYTPADVALVDRGFLCELNYDRIRDVVTAFGDDLRDKATVVTATVAESTNMYEPLDENLRKLLYFNTFSDLEPMYPDAPATETIQLHTNFDTVKVKGSLDLSKFRKVTLTQEVLDKYKEKCASFGHCRISNMSKGYVWVDKSDKIVGFVNVVRKQDNIKWIQALNLQSEYQGYGLYEQLLKVAVRELGGTDIETPPKNDNAREVYEKFGFKTYTDEQSRKCMSIRADAAKSKYGDKAKTNATNMTEAGLFPVFIILTNASKLEGNYSKLLTSANYAHVSVAFNSDMANVYSFGTKDGHNMLPIDTESKSLMVKLKTDPDANYALYVKLVSKKVFEAVNSKVKSMYAQKGGFRYDLPGAVKEKMKDTNEKSYFCSSFASYITGESKDTTEVPDIKNIHLVDMGLVRDYKQAFVDKKVDSIYKKYYMHKEKDSEKQPIDEDKKDEEE